MIIPLRAGYWTNDPRLDRIRGQDLRSLNYLARDRLTAEQREPRSYTWLLETFLDQGQEGACVGFAFAHELAARPGIVLGVTPTYAREQLYWSAQRDDPWEGGAYPGARPFYDGTTVLAGVRVVHQLGLIAEYRWATSVLEFASAVSYFGPGVIGIDMFEGMLDADSYGFIHPTGRWVGGHALCVTGVRVIRDKTSGAIDWVSSYLLCHNSWGRGWGQGGRAKITFADMALLVPGADLCIPIGRRAVEL